MIPTLRPDLCWVVGAGGLVGRSVVAYLRSRAFVGETYAWHDPHQLSSQFGLDAGRFAAQLRKTSNPLWGIVWVAGKGVVGASDSDFELEHAALESLFGAVSRQSLPGRGCAFLASSAGAAYAGGAEAPFTEFSASCPTSAYGRAKLEQERLLRKHVADGHLSAGVIGRIANVYGPGQDLGKGQGLITHLCRAAVTSGIVNIYVPFDTRRHYIYSEDVARFVEFSLMHAAAEAPGSCHVKIISAGESVTVGEAISVVSRVAHRRVRVSAGVDRRAAFQSPDLRLRSVVWRDMDRLPTMPFHIGVSKVMRGIEKQAAQGWRGALPAS